MIRISSSLQFKIPTVFIVSFLFILAAIFVVFATIGKSLLEKQAYKQVILSGENIVAELGQRVALAESLATALANLGEKLPADDGLSKELIAHLLNYEGTESFVAGGGLWPAPYQYDPTVERRSFFWGRDESGVLQFYDDYNNPEGPGYHHEEWYVPAQHLNEGEVFWSKSYMDPYSYQPMVTVTVPMYRDGKFYGVSTVDLKLEGLNDFLDKISGSFGGYAFALDRNGKFLSFPDEKLSKTYSTDVQGARTEEFITVDELSHKYPRFQPLASAVQDSIGTVIREAGRLSTFDPKLAASIAAESYQIDDKEAQLIAAVLAVLRDSTQSAQREPKQLFIDDDMLLDEPAYAAVFEMPRTFWKIVTVMPHSMAIADSSLIHRNLVSAIVVVMCASLLVILLVVRRILVRPIVDMAQQLRRFAEDEESSDRLLTLSDKGELGNLAFWFNRRSQKLFDVQKDLREAQEQLERRVAERTEKLRQEMEMRQAEQARREARVARVEKQHAAIVELSVHESLFEGYVEEAARIITETVAHVTDVARASIWLLDDQDSRLRLVDLYERATGSHDSGAELKVEDCPAYFDALRGDRSCAVYDISKDERTQDLADYARRHGIASLLDSPIRVGGRLRGVVCFEHVGDKRAWHEDEIRFSGEIADQFVQVLTNAERIRSEEKIRQLAFYDPLTDLANRRLLQEAVQHELEVARRQGTYGSLLYFDLDNFKTLNDSLGHSIGDELLVQVAERLQTTLRREDTASRLGGDEFVVLLNGERATKHDAMEQALTVARKLQEAISKPYRLQGYEYIITTSIGISVYPEDEKTAADVLKQADAAMYRAKKEGRNNICFYNPAMQREAKIRLLLEQELRAAISRREFQLYFQPQVGVDGRAIGGEALIRWNHPTRGVVPPAAFIPTAEEAGLILEIGNWVLREACEFSKECTLALVAVNISPLQFRQKDFVETVMAILEESGVDPRTLMIELTEGIVIENIEDTISKMKRLKEMGIGMAIDDFGTGYSSLAYLKQLPLDQLKINNKFVRDINTDPNDAIIVDTIISMAQHLGLGVVAEGVETTAQLKFLEKRGCQMFQGYYFSKPLPKSEFIGYLTGVEQGDGNVIDANAGAADVQA